MWHHDGSCAKTRTACNDVGLAEVPRRPIFLSEQLLQDSFEPGMLYSVSQHEPSCSGLRLVE